MIRLKHFIPLLFVIPFISSCYYDNLEELHPVISATKCDTSGTISYANDIVPILTGYCSVNNSSCHNSTTFYPMDTYSAVFDQAVATAPSCSGSLLVLSLKHDACLGPGPAHYMPLSSDGKVMLDSCSIMKIEAWVNRGSPNN